MCPTQTISLHTTVVVGTFSLLESRHSTILLLTLVRRIVTEKNSSVRSLAPKVLDSVGTSSLQRDEFRARGAYYTFSGRPRMEELETHTSALLRGLKIEDRGAYFPASTNRTKGHHIKGTGERVEDERRDISGICCSHQRHVRILLVGTVSKRAESRRIPLYQTVLKDLALRCSWLNMRQHRSGQEVSVCISTKMGVHTIS